MTTSADSTEDSDSAGYTLLISAFVALLALIACVQLWPLNDRLALIEEGGPFENLTIVGYAVCIFLMAKNWTWEKLRARWYFVALVLLFVARELDLDKSLFTIGLLKSRQYVGDMVSLPEKAVSLVIVAAVLYVLFSAFRSEMRNFVNGIVTLLPNKLAVLSAALLIVATKSMDGIERKLAPLGVDVSQGFHRFAQVFEEIGEFGIPVLIAVAILTSQDARSRS